MKTVTLIKRIVAASASIMIFTATTAFAHPPETGFNQYGAYDPSAAEQESLLTDEVNKPDDSQTTEQESLEMNKTNDEKSSEKNEESSEDKPMKKESEKTSLEKDKSPEP